MSTISIQNGGVTACIDTLGAQLTSLARGGDEYLWQADPRWWNRHAPVLFPIVGSIRGDKASSQQGPVALGRHGLARNYEHAVVSQSPSSVTFELTDSSETRALYPYAFKLNMTYALSDEGVFTQTFRVENTGEVDLPFSVGGHPAFNVPAPGAEGEAFEDYELEFAKPWTFESATIVDGGLLTYDVMNPIVKDSDHVALSRRLFDYDTVMLEDVPGSTVTLRGTKSGRGVRVNFEGFKYLGVWSAAGDAPFVALEPWTGHATLTSEDDVFEHKRNITVLAPGKVDERSFSVTLL
ncbi:aldose 1-epimerase family protein [Collinsella sp. An2]|uniref:aldose 1-epimerase family protein n=1 Tax=Collinsella sp. An2 TaxID=1965585 RepID=UPI000B39BC14|nr:aldose 1-epimerase family protein [Collinsella sp. An2]OUP06708.1 aldose epimerase [Collinsella sp. An2]